MKKIIIFDFDGVIINEFAKHYEFTKNRIKDLTEEEFKGLFEGNFHTELEKFKDRNVRLDAKNNYNEYQKTVIINPGIKAVLQKLHKKYILGIISSAKESGPETVLKNSKLKRIFSFDYGSETHKIKTEKFKMVLEKFNVKPEECVFITDTSGDILEAKKVGIKSIAVDYGYHEREKLLKAKPIKIISSFKDIEKAIEEID